MLSLPTQNRIAALALLSLVAVPCEAQALAELTAAQRQSIAEGGQVFLTSPGGASPWPRACVYQRIEARPDEAAAVFIDYERHRTYIPDLRKSSITRVVDAATVEVDYTLAVPVVADEHYTLRDQLSAGADGSYRVVWSLVRATSTKATDGSVRFEPYRDSLPERERTLMAHCNLVTPGSRLARLPFVRSRAFAQLRDAARAIVTEIERVRTRDPALLAARLRVLHAAIGQSERPSPDHNY